LEEKKEMKKIPDSLNKTDGAENRSYELNTTGFIKIANANPNRLYFSVCNCSLQGIKLNLCSIGEANEDAGIFVKEKGTWVMPKNIYTGEICAIGSVAEQKISVCEY